MKFEAFDKAMRDLPGVTLDIKWETRRTYCVGGRIFVLAGSVGDHVGPYAILGIAPTQVTVSGPSGMQTLALHFGPEQPSAAPGPSILDRLRTQHYRPPPLPSSAALGRLLLQQQPGPPR